MRRSYPFVGTFILGLTAFTVNLLIYITKYDVFSTSKRAELLIIMIAAIALMALSITSFKKL